MDWKASFLGFFCQRLADLVQLIKYLHVGTVSTQGEQSWAAFLQSHGMIWRTSRSCFCLPLPSSQMQHLVLISECLAGRCVVTSGMCHSSEGVAHTKSC